MGNIIGGIILLPIKLALWLIEMLGRMAVLAIGIIGLLIGAIICGVPLIFIAGMLVCVFSVVLIVKAVDGS